MFRVLDRVVAEAQPALTGARVALHTLSMCVLFGIASLSIVTERTISTNPNLVWFVQHWPYTDKKWGCLFMLLCIGGILPFVFRGKWSKLFGALSVGSGHAMIFNAVVSINVINTGVTTYGAVATASMGVIVISLIEEKW